MKSISTFLAVLLLISISSLVQGQSKKSQYKFPLPLVISGRLSVTEYAGELEPAAGLQVGMMVNKNLLIGLDGSLFSPWAKYSGALDDQKVALYAAYGGILIEPVINPRNTLHLSFPVITGGGLIAYRWDSENRGGTKDIEEGDFHLSVTPGIALNYRLNHFMRMQLVYSYRYARKISLRNTAEDAFDGHNLGLALRLGRFKD